MKSYTDLKFGSSGSAIMEALNKGTVNSVSSFGSVDHFIQGLLGSNFIRDKKSTTKNENPNNIKENTNKKNFNPPNIEDNNELPDLEESEVLSDDDIVDGSSLYKVYRDREEDFQCEIVIQGAKLSNAQVRLVFDHDICNLVFYGKIYKEGKCLVPLKRMSFYPEGSTGNVKLEVIVDDNIFVPWEETFIVEGSKKITVQVNTKKNYFK